MKSRTFILGAGITGRLIQTVVPDTTILESKLRKGMDRLNVYYGTNYLWEPLNIPGLKLRPVDVVTRVDGKEPTEESIQRYKNKIGKSDEGKDEWGLQFKTKTTGYVIESYPTANVEYGSYVTGIDMNTHKMEVTTSERKKYFTYDMLFSTIPLNRLLETIEGLNARHPLETLFKYKPIYVKIVPLPPEISLPSNAFYVNYLSDPTIQPYRYCDKMGERHYESLTPIGFPHKKLFPGKIWTSPGVDKILKELRSHGIYCFGRYGAWQPNELIHQTYQKIKEA